MATFKGIAFPFQAGQTSFPAAAEDSDLIKQSIIQIVMTTKGERVMRPTFGSGVMRSLFENNTETLVAQLRSEVYSAITSFETRCIVQNVIVERQESEVVITVAFVVPSTSQQDVVKMALPLG